LSAVHLLSDFGAPSPFLGCNATRTSAALTRLSLSAILPAEISSIWRNDWPEMMSMDPPSQAAEIIENLRNLGIFS
jgi:hypothetical protein